MFFDEIRFGDKDPVQHVCFVVHGIGEACDSRFRPLVECVEDLRDTSRTILQSHFKSYLENGEVQRIVCHQSSTLSGNPSVHSLGISTCLLAW